MIQGHLKAAGPYEAGLTPEEREELLREKMTVNPRVLNPYAVQGAKARLMGKHPVAALALSSLFSSPKYAMVTLAAFGDELKKVKESGWFDRIAQGVQDLTRGGTFVGGTAPGGPADAFKKWQAAQELKNAPKSLSAARLKK